MWFVRVDEDEAVCGMVLGSGPSSRGGCRTGSGKCVGWAEAGPVVCVAGVVQFDGRPRRMVDVLFEIIR